jgi:elongation factor G
LFCISCQAADHVGISLLFAAGAISRKGSIAEGNTTSDYNADEIQRKNSINSSLCHLSWRQHFVQMVDTPGYADFAADMLGAVRAVDAGVLLVDATGGVEVGTERAWDALEELKLPRLIFINKIDKENVNLDEVIREIKERLSKAAAVVSFPISAELKETIAETNDELLERYSKARRSRKKSSKKPLKMLS